MKKMLLAGCGLLLAASVSAQSSLSTLNTKMQVPAQRTCGVMDHETWLEQNNPARAAQRAAFEQQVQAWIASNQNNPTPQALITIPCVVHVVYNTAAQNISNAQVLSQITALNADFTRTNADASNTPAAFQGVASNVELNFCLAQQDPMGNPTTGINRVPTSVTSFSTNDAVKFTASGGANAWDPSRYFNIWVCPLGGGLLGYAEFPTGTLSNTYGVVIGYNYFGTTGTLSPPYNLGRTATHELGHCFNLFHIWGDDGNACTGSDQCADTPNQANENYGCPTFPTISCSNGPNGEMFMNYMDYTDDACMNMFTAGQKARVLAVLNNPPYNALQTSTACVPPANAPPVALFSANTTAVCPGTPITFTDQSSVNTTGWSWTFPSGTPATSTLQNPPAVTWSTPGTYTVTLVASNVNGTSTYTMVVTVLGVVNPPLTEGFEGTTYPPAGWTLFDAGSNGINWLRFNAGRNSSWSSKFDNYNNDVQGLRDDLRTPRLNLSTAATCTLTFDVAHRPYGTGPNYLDTLEVLVSTNCGATWTQAFIKGGATLATVTGTQTTAFTPTNTQWRNETVYLNSYVGQSGVMITFRNRGHYGNNIYVDNVNITTTTSTIPNAAFTASTTTVCAGSPVSFTDNSTNSPTSWGWTFPSATPGSSTQQNPSNVVWNTAGTYTVTHTATNGSGTGTQTLVITVNPRPTITASAGTPTICNGSSTALTGGGGVSYAWMPGSLSGSPVTVSPTGTTTYTVTGTGSNGCTNTQTVTVTVNNLPTITATAGTPTICSGSSTALTGGGGVSYSWMPGSLSGSPVTVSPTGTTTYTVTGTGSNGCTNTQTVTVTVNPLPTITATASSPTICNGSSTTLTGGGGVSYSWMPGSLSGSPVTVSPTGTTTYTVTGTGSNGCTRTQTVTVTVNNLPTITASAGTTTICSGSSTTLTGGGGVSYSWMPGSLSGSPVTVSPTGTTTYTVTGTGSNGCTNTQTVTVTVNTLPTITATASSPTICNGSSTTLTGGGGVSYSWMPGSLSGSPVTVSPTGTTTYTVTGTGSNGCTRTQTVTVTVNNLPTITASAASGTICTGNSTTLTGGGGTTYSWMPGSLSGGTVTVSPASTTTYTVTGTGSNGCTNTQTVSVAVVNQPTVTATAAASSICTGSGTTLTGGGATTYSWMPGSLSGTTVSVSPTTTTTYTVTGTATGGCQNTQTVTVTVNALPTITASASNTSICAGNSTSLTGSGGLTYDWMPGLLNGATVNITPASTTTYTVTGTDANGCQNTGTVAVNVNSLPNVTFAPFASDTMCLSDGVLTLSGESPTGGSFSGNGVSGSSFDPFAAGLGTHLVTYTYTDGNGCSNSASQNMYVDICTDIAPVISDQLSMTVMPNPNNGNFQLSFGNKNRDNCKLEILSTLGQLVYREELNGFQGSSSRTIDISGYGAGMYVVRLSSSESEVITRVIIR